MSKNPNYHKLLYEILFTSLKIPFISKITLSLYIRMGTYQRKRNRNPWRRLPKGCTFIMYEPRFKYILKELEERELNVVILARGIFDYLFQKHLSEYTDKSKRNFGEYALDAYERYKEERGHYLKDCTYISNILKKHFSASTIILPKYNDDYTLELVQAFHNTGWTTIVYDREGTVTKKRLELVPLRVSRMAPECDYIIVYNETHKAFFEKVFSLSDIQKPKIVVMGNPASDEWFQNDKLAKLNTGDFVPGCKKITFFAFGEFSYVYDAAYLEGKDQVWRGLLADIHDALADHLMMYPNDELRYKRGPKGNRDYWAGSENLLKLPNAKLIPSKADSNSLIVDSDFILAFQTTALIDAMHTNKVIIYCAWGQNYEELKDGLMDFEEYARDGAILHAHSSKELKNILSRDPREVTVNLKARKKIREFFTTNPDGRVAIRFADWSVETFSPNS